MFRSLCGFVAAALVITAAACAPVVPEDPNTIEITKVGSYSYMRQSRDLAIVVDVEMARKRTEEAYFPLGIKIANKRLGQVIVDRETLVLVDENGRIYPMPGVVELERNYDKLVPDHKFQSQTGIMGDTLLTGFSYYQKADSRFFPQVQGGGRVIDSVKIRAHGYLEDMIYFPMPEGGIKGRMLRLRLDVYELEKPFEIVFPVQ
ncbi:MAG TPA: hypothetical protein PK207_10250 [Candidatus Aminicenantes bacterium]|jgi:hypothetical protein|nr:hypothetical protein [Candidatus Aminicenantes bacterium]HOF83425.1 hypothetical protein [Candidatus Aminicenantes bacterium]HOS12004.1 hypothetical protein [Candidatus Aminicenantes bacterium]HPH45099.1 hypothetical protein [Candidatus Aminicenantes bacterium]HPL14575.1 hypothetical protein [Candidatus Aminicenantes bacterium]